MEKMERAESEFLDSFQKLSVPLQVLLQHMDGGILVIEVTKPLHFLYSSPSYFAMLSGSNEPPPYPLTEVSQFACKEDCALLEHALYQSIETGQPANLVYRNSTPSGAVQWHHLQTVQSENPCCLVAVVTNITRVTCDIQKEEFSYSKLHKIFEMSHLETYEVDIQEHSVLFSTSTQNKYGIPNQKMLDMPSSIIQEGVIHLDSIEVYQGMYDEIYAGTPEGNCLVKVHRPDGHYGLVKLSYCCLFDANGKAIKAVGISEDLEAITEDVLRLEQEHKLRTLLCDDFILNLKINVSHNRLEYVGKNKSAMKEITPSQTYSAFYEQQQKFLSNEEEKMLLSNQFTLEKIRESFMEGNTSIIREFHLKEANGKLIWVTQFVRMYVNPATGDLYAFLYIRNVDIQRKWELSLPMKVERDSLYSLYLPATLRNLTNFLLSSADDFSQYSLAIIGVVDYDVLRTNFGGQNMEKLLHALSRKIRMYLEIRHLLSYMGNGLFALLFTEISSKQWIKDKLQEVLKMLRNTTLFLTFEESYTSYRVGVALQTQEKPTFDKLYADAYSAFQAASLSDQEKDAIVFFEEPMHSSSTFPTSTPAELKNALSNKVRFSQPIRNTDEDIPFLYSCGFLMSDANSLTESVGVVLEKIGIYYQATRVSFLEIDKFGTSMNEKFVWHNKEQSTKVEKIKHINVSKSALLQKVLQTKEAILVTDIVCIKEDSPEIYSILLSAGIRTFMLIPLFSKQENFGFIVAYNASSHMENIEMACIVAMMLCNERAKRKALEKEKNWTRFDAFSGVLNYTSYMEYCAKINPEMLSSIGILFVDANGLKKINHEFGTEVGNKAILTEAVILQEYFSEQEVYRCYGGTFLVLCTDISYESFMQKVIEIRTTLTKEYPGNYSFGYTWSDTIETIDKLVNHAEELMIADKQECHSRLQREDTEQRSQRLKELLLALQQNWFEVYLQPKMKISNSMFYGAEALIRMNHPQYGLLSPVKFIPAVEKDGSVRYIDLFVLEEVCKLLEHLKKVGTPLIPISLNFSRATVLEPGIIDSMLEIVNRYDVNRANIEIEITESLGDFEWETITTIADAIVRAGFLLSLDDFGAKYSNLSILASVGFTMLKLDKSLVDRIVSNKKSTIIAESVIKLCNSFGIDSLAEGVETEEQLKALRVLGCNYAQGYFFNKPLPMDIFVKKYLNQRKSPH